MNQKYDYLNRNMGKGLSHVSNKKIKWLSIRCLLFAKDKAF